MDRNDEKGRNGGKKLKGNLTMPEKDKRGPNCLKRDEIDQKVVNSFMNGSSKKFFTKWVKIDLKGQNRAIKT